MANEQKEWEELNKLKEKLKAAQDALHKALAPFFRKAKKVWEDVKRSMDEFIKRISN